MRAQHCTARITAYGKTVSEMQAQATAEFSRLFEGREFSMHPRGHAEPDIVFGADQSKGAVYRWKMDWAATCPAGEVF